MTAVRAEAVELQTVSLNDEAVLGRHFLLQSFDLAVLEFHDFPATGADEVIVVPFVRDVVILRLGAEVAGLGQARFAEEIQGPVDGCQAEVRVLLGQLMVHGLGRDVFLTEERFQNEFPLPRQLQLMLRQMLAKHVHFLGGFPHDFGLAYKRLIKNESTVTGQVADVFTILL